MRRLLTDVGRLDSLLEGEVSGNLDKVRAFAGKRRRVSRYIGQNNQSK